MAGQYEAYSRQNLACYPAVPFPLYGRTVGRSVLIPDREQYTPGMKHSFVEMMFTVAGTGGITLYQQEFSQEPGSVFFYLPGEDHRLRASSDFWEVRWLCFDGPLAVPILSGYGLPRCFRMPPEFAGERLDTMARLIGDASPAAARRVTALILELLGYSEEERAGEDLIQAAVRFINDNLSNFDLDVNRVADYLDIHRSTFARLFREKIGQTPHFYIAARRMGRAEALLRGGDTPIGRIAEICGFRDDTNFCRHFRRRHHQTPTQYRRAPYD